jgi:hypothetical protein
LGPFCAGKVIGKGQVTPVSAGIAARFAHAKETVPAVRVARIEGIA